FCFFFSSRRRDTRSKRDWSSDVCSSDLDIIPFVYYFLNKFNQEQDRNKVISQKCLNVLTNYSWPGNIRQLENLMERLVITSERLINVDHLLETVFKGDKQTGDASGNALTMNEAVEQTKAEMIKQSYQKHKSSRKVAEDLQVSQTTATRLIKKYCASVTT